MTWQNFKLTNLESCTVTEPFRSEGLTERPVQTEMAPKKGWGCVMSSPEFVLMSDTQAQEVIFPHMSALKLQIQIQWKHNMILKLKSVSVRHTGFTFFVIWLSFYAIRVCWKLLQLPKNGAIISQSMHIVQFGA